MGIKDFLKKRIKEARDKDESKSKKGKNPDSHKIDDSEYQANYDYFKDRKCPYCQFQLKQVVKKGAALPVRKQLVTNSILIQKSRCC